jgi:predicted alpha-1,2-mannosidase
MKNLKKYINLLSSISIILLFLNCSQQKEKTPADYVDPFICTQGDHGHWIPAALVPFGIVKLSPDTYPGSLTADGNFAHGGYDFSDDSLRGFSHFHKPSSGGTAIVDRAGLLSVFPFNGSPGNDFFVRPVAISDVDGAYPGLDGKIHIAKGYRHFNDYAFWDDFRTKYPLYSLYLPDIYREISRSLLDLYEQADNALPFPDSEHNVHGSGNMFVYRGKNGFQPYSTCRHEHTLMTVADAYFKGISDTDIKTVYPYLKREILWQMPEKYDETGYIPARPDRTGEYSWDSWCVAQVAKSIGNDEDYEYFMKRSKYWENSWDPEIKYFRARASDGTWLDFPEDPRVNREKYNYEGSKWHWRWNVLHDMPALIEKFGGKENFVDTLTYYFNNDLHSQGNQPDLHVPFLFNYGGAPWLTQKWVRKILVEPIVQLYGTHGFFPEPIFDRVYKATPDGYLLEMDCDYGCMAAWYNIAAIGLYQVCPGNPVYQITAPIFDEVSIDLDNSIYKGDKFTIKANNLSEKNIYIQSALLNGQPLYRSWLKHEEIVKGGNLVYQMGPEPNKDWGNE